MCLIISPYKHFFLSPKISLFPIKVFKILINSPCGHLTPYRRHSVNFIDGKCVLSAKFDSNFKWTHTVEEGIHGYYKLENATADLKHLFKDGGCIYKAIIPPFTKYFYGFGGNIVSEKMIITNVPHNK